MKEMLQIGIKNIKNVSDIVFVFRDINCLNLKIFSSNKNQGFNEHQVFKIIGYLVLMLNYFLSRF